MVMEYLDLYDLFAVYVFGSSTWAIFGVALIIFAITMMGKWSPILRYVYILNVLFASFYVTNQTFWLVIMAALSIMWCSYGIWRLWGAYRGQS